MLLRSAFSNQYLTLRAEQVFSPPKRLNLLLKSEAVSHELQAFTGPHNISTAGRSTVKVAEELDACYDAGLSVWPLKPCPTALVPSVYAIMVIISCDERSNRQASSKLLEQDPIL